MAPYLDIAGFKVLSTMPVERIDELEAIAPGFLAAKLAAKSRWIDARLTKRYAVPFAEPCPDTVKDWLARIVTPVAHVRLGVPATDEQFVVVQKDAEDAEAEVLEAAEAERGLFELPLREDTTASGVSKGGPLGYSEQSPYVWTDVQREIATAEDSHRRGTGG